MRRAALPVAVMVGVAGCRGPTAPPPTVRFVIDAPLCSSVIPVELSIDGALVGRDTFIVNYGPPHVATRAFETTAGTHVLGARATFGYLWPDTTVTLGAGQAITRKLEFYCS